MYEKVKGIEKKVDSLIGEKNNIPNNYDMAYARIENNNTLKNVLLDQIANYRDLYQSNFKESDSTLRNLQLDKLTNNRNFDQNVDNHKSITKSDKYHEKKLTSNDESIFIKVKPIHAWEYDGKPDPDISKEYNFKPYFVIN